MSADQAPERAVYHAAGKQAHLDFVEPEAEIAQRHHAVVAVDREHRAAGRRMAREAVPHSVATSASTSADPDDCHGSALVEFYAR